jgi:hypothetical protein
MFEVISGVERSGAEACGAPHRSLSLITPRHPRSITIAVSKDTSESAEHGTSRKGENHQHNIYLCEANLPDAPTALSRTANPSAIDLMLMPPFSTLLLGNLALYSRERLN